MVNFWGLFCTTLQGILMSMTEPRKIPHEWMEPLTMLGMEADQRANLEVKIRLSVARCINAGASWSQVALMLGTSTQAAWERYRTTKPEKGTRTLIEQSTLFEDLRVTNGMDRQEKRHKRRNSKGREQY